MKNIKICICVLALFVFLSACGNSTQPETPLSFQNIDFSGCRVEVLEHAINGGESLGELNVTDTEYFVDIITSVELGVEISNYEIADGESAKQYLITLANGEKIYFGQGYGEADGYPNGCFVHINDKVYLIQNPAVLNALYVINERFAFYDRVSSVIE